LSQSVVAHVADTPNPVMKLPTIETQIHLMSFPIISNLFLG
jgi:hypothetical protein